MSKRLQMIGLLLFGYTIVFIDKTVIGFALLPIEKEFDLSAQQLGYLTGLFFLTYSCFQIPAGWLNDRIGYKKMLIISLALLGAFALCFGLLGASLGLLLLFRALSGIGHAGYPASCAKAVVSNFPPAQRTFAQSILLSSAGLAMTIGPVLAVWALSQFGWRHSFVTLGVVACLVALLIVVIIPGQTISRTSIQAAKQQGLFKNKALLLMFLSIFCVNIPNYGMMAWLPKFLVQHMAMPVSVSGYIIAFGGFGIWLSSLATGWLVGKYFDGKEARVIMTCAAIGAVCILAIYYMTSPLSAALFLFIGQVCLMATFVTVFTLPMKRLPENIMGSAMGFINTGGTLGGFVSPIVMGYLVNATGSFHSAFIFLSVAMLCAGLAILPLYVRTAATPRAAI